MIYRTEVRDRAVFEQAIDENILLCEINATLKNMEIYLKKDDKSSCPVIEMDFMMDIIQDKELESPFVYINFHGNWESHLLYDIVRDIICDIFYDVPETFVDCGDIVSIEYEVED